MKRLDFLRELKKVEETIVISDPIDLKAEAFLIVPDRDVPLGTRRAVFENWFDESSDALVLGNQSEESVTVVTRFTAYSSDFDKAAEIAVAFFDASLATFRRQMTHGQRFNQSIANLNNIRTVGQVPASFDGRPGWEMLLDLTLFSEVF